MSNYYSEIVLLTKSDYTDELECWINWYLNILQFNHIVIYDNDSSISIPSIITKFPEDKIEYHPIQGWPNQYQLYTNHVRQSKANWIMALDDDEYLYIGEKFNHNIRNLIDYLYTTYRKNKYYFLWVNMFSPEYHRTRAGLYINTHTSYSYSACRRIHSSWPWGNDMGKSLINNQFDYEYSFNKDLGHIPRCLNGDNTTLLYDGTVVNSVCVNTQDKIQEDCFIAHYQYKSDSDWELKCSRPVASSQSYNLKSKKHIYRKLYEYKDMFKSCTLLKDLNISK